MLLQKLPPPVLRSHTLPLLPRARCCHLLTCARTPDSSQVHALQDGAPPGGCDVSLLFRYNALTLLLTDGFTTVEYVHIRAHSARVAIGERVSKGQVLCETGDAGFCPVPHLHIEAHTAALQNPAAPSVPIAFAVDIAAAPGTAATAAGAAAADAESASEALAASFVPEAGGWYSSSGHAAPPVADALGDAEEKACGDEPHAQSSEDESSGGWETVSDD